METLPNWTAEQLPLTSSLEDSRVSLGALPEKEKAQPMPVTSGRKWLALSQKLGPVGSVVKTLLESSVWHSNVCVLTWKVSAMKSRRLLFRLVPSVRRIDETGYGFLPTPRAQERQQRNSQDRYVALSLFVKQKLLPTIRSHEVGDYQYSRGDHSKKVLTLTGAVKQFPTPTANRRRGLQSHGVNVVTGSLNPRFVEEMMGYPIEWSDCEPSATL